MFPFKKKNNSAFLNPTFLFLISILFINVHAQNNSVLIMKGQTLTSGGKSGLAGSMGVRTAKTSEEAVEGVDFELKKNDASVAKTTSAKKGKYSLQMQISTTDNKNDYVIYLSMDGMVPRMVLVNAFIPKEEFAKYGSSKIDFEQDFTMLKTSIKDIVPDKAFMRIKWDDVKDHKFIIDPAYAKTVQKEELKMTPNPDLYYKNLAKRKKKDEETTAKNKAAADAKLKADEEAKKKAAEEEAKRLAELKAKEEADRLAREKEEALRKEMLAKHIADSLAEAQRKRMTEAANSKQDIQKIIKPVESDDNDGAAQYDAAESYSLNMARKSLNEEKQRRSREKGKNLTMKYETSNVLTSLLNTVDEQDKKERKQ